MVNKERLKRKLKSSLIPSSWKPAIKLSTTCLCQGLHGSAKGSLAVTIISVTKAMWLWQGCISATIATYPWYDLFGRDKGCIALTNDKCHCKGMYGRNKTVTGLHDCDKDSLFIKRATRWWQGLYLCKNWWSYGCDRGAYLWQMLHGSDKDFYL